MNKIILVVLLSTTIFADVISVTGFKNNTSNPKNDWIGEAIADNLTTDLSKIDKIKVVSRSSLKDVLKYLDKNPKIIDINGHLNPKFKKKQINTELKI